MIDPVRFLREATRRQWEMFTGVPCSHLGSLLACVQGDPGTRCVTAASEGDAVAIACGSALGGGDALVYMQNSGLGNAVNPLASLCWPMQLPVLLLVTLRGDPAGAPDEPQHRLMGRITLPLLDLLEIPSEVLAPDADAATEALARARSSMNATGRPYALIVRPDTFDRAEDPPAAAPAPKPRREPVERRPFGDRSSWPSPLEALRSIVDATPVDESVVISSTGYTSRRLYGIADRPNHLYMVGSMGCASALGLGLSLARPDLRVVVVEGDGAALMRLGNRAVVGAHAAGNLVHVILDNEVHASTGGQPTVSPGVCFAGIASACGYADALEGDSLGALDDALRRPPAPDDGPRLVHLKVQAGASGALPRPRSSPRQVCERLVAHLGVRPDLRETHAAAPPSELAS